MAKDTRWDRNLSVAPDAEGLIGHAGAVLLRKLADQCGLTSALGAALGRKGKFPLIDRGQHALSQDFPKTYDRLAQSINEQWIVEAGNRKINEPTRLPVPWMVIQDRPFDSWSR